MQRRWVWLCGLLAFGFATACSEDPEETTCTFDTDCKKIDDCCEGCLAVRVDQLFLECADSCLQSPCTAAEKEDHVAVCRNGACTLVEPSN